MDLDAMGAKFTTIRKLTIKTRAKQGEHRARLLEQILAKLDEFYAEYGNPFVPEEGRAPRSRRLDLDCGRYSTDKENIMAKIKRIDRSLSLLERQQQHHSTIMHAKERLLKERSYLLLKSKGVL